MTFSEALPAVLKYEGGFVNDPKDSGGATNQGITQTTYDEWRVSQSLPIRSVQYIHDAEVSTIYKNIFWNTSACHLMPYPLAFCVFDFAVHSGPRRAILILQRVLGIQRDGIAGPRTIAAISSVPLAGLIHDYTQARRTFLEGLARQRPKDQRFIRGWLRRVSDVERRAIRTLGGPAAISKGSSISNGSDV